MKMSTVAPVPAGSCCIRDQRAWQCVQPAACTLVRSSAPDSAWVVRSGGTPNLSDAVRGIPHFGMVCAPWYRCDTRKALPRYLYDRLGDAGKHACRYVAADSDDVGPVPWGENFEKAAAEAPKQVVAKI